MQVTVWRQFSSNHSAEYTIVGVFPTAAAAAHVGTDLKDLVTRIRRWREVHNDQQFAVSPPEREAEQTYGVVWEQPVDWLGFDHRLPDPALRTPDQHIVVQDTLVIVDAPGGSHTWQTGHQFAKVLAATGAQVFHEIYMGDMPNDHSKSRFASASFDLTATAPDAATAEAVHAALHTYVDASKAKHHLRTAFIPMPWAIYHDRAWRIQHKLTPATYAAAEAHWFADRRAQAAFAERIRARGGGTVRWTDADRAAHAALATQGQDIAAHIALFRGETTFRAVYVGRNGAAIRLEGAAPVYPLAALLRWLGALHCATTYTLTQVSDVVR